MPKLRINYLSRFGFECAIELERSDIKALLAEAAEVQEQMVKQSVAPTQNGRRPSLPKAEPHQVDDKSAIRQAIKSLSSTLSAGDKTRKSR